MKVFGNRLYGKLACIAVISGIAFSFPAATSADDDALFSTLTAVWWQWAYSVPLAHNPGVDTTGKFADKGQPFPNLFFLAGTYNQVTSTNGDVVGFADRSITVDRGTAFFFPVLNSEFDNVAFDTPSPGVATVVHGKKAMTVSQLRASAAAQVDGATGLVCTLTPTGHKAVDVPMERVKSPVFSYFLPEESIYEKFGEEIEGWVTPAVSDGYWSYMPPLARGSYRLHFGGSFAPDSDNHTFSVDITYHITVK